MGRRGRESSRRPNLDENRMTDTTHKCPAPGCTARVTRAKLACIDHWNSLPEELQEDVIRGHKIRHHDDGRAHMLAIVAASNWLQEATPTART